MFSKCRAGPTFFQVNVGPTLQFVKQMCEKKTIQPLCDTQERLVCTYEPEETCNDVDKQYCHKVEKVVLEEVCDMKFDTRYL